MKIPYLTHMCPFGYLLYQTEEISEATFLFLIWSFFLKLSFSIYILLLRACTEESMPQNSCISSKSEDLVTHTENF